MFPLKKKYYDAIYTIEGFESKTTGDQTPINDYYNIISSLNDHVKDVEADIHEPYEGCS